MIEIIIILLAFSIIFAMSAAKVKSPQEKIAYTAVNLARNLYPDASREELAMKVEIILKKYEKFEKAHPDRKPAVHFNRIRKVLKGIGSAGRFKRKTVAVLLKIAEVTRKFDPEVEAIRQDQFRIFTGGKYDRKKKPPCQIYEIKKLNSEEKALRISQGFVSRNQIIVPNDPRENFVFGTWTRKNSDFENNMRPRTNKWEITGFCKEANAKYFAPFRMFVDLTWTPPIKDENNEQDFFNHFVPIFPDPKDLTKQLDMRNKVIQTVCESYVSDKTSPTAYKLFYRGDQFEYKVAIVVITYITTSGTSGIS